MIDNRTVGKTISTLRQAHGMTQQQLAAAMNVSHQAVSKWENGAALPDIQTLLGLTQLFGITVEQLLSGEIPEARMEEEKPSTIDQHFQRVGHFVSNIVEDIGSAFRTERVENVPETEDAPEADEENVSEENGNVNIDFGKLMEMAPFMSKGAVSEMIGKLGRPLTASEIARIAPFVEPACLEKIIRESEGDFGWESLRRIAPFLKKEVVDAFARTIALGEKYVKPVSGEMNRVAEDMWKTMDGVSRKIEKGVDRAIRKVVRFGENAVSEVSKAFDDLTSEATVREERLARLRRTAFERAMEDGRWDWIAAHIDEVQDEDLRRRISEAANRQGMREWVFEHLGGYADPETIDSAIINEEWDWLSEHAEQFDGPTQRFVAKAAMQAGKWDWLQDCSGRIDLGDVAAEIADAALAAGEKELAAQLVRNQPDGKLAADMALAAAGNADVDFIGLISDVLPEDVMGEICAVLARMQRWDDVERFGAELGVEKLEMLMEIAIDMGDFDAVDRMDALLKRDELEDEV